MDDDIAGNRMRFSELLDAIIEAKLPEDVYFHGSMRADNITDEILDKTKSANFRMLSFGMETSNESLMRLINKGETVKQVINAIKKTDQKGITVATTIIFGLPGETRKERLETIKTVNNLPLSSVRFNILTPYPGTPVFEMLNQSGEIQIKKDWENFAVQYMWEGDELPYLSGGNNIYELIFDTMFANLQFYLSLKGIKRMLKSSFAGGNVIMFSRRWYLSPTAVWNLVLVVSYLIYRFLYIYLRMISDKFINGNARKYKSIRDNLLSFTNHNNLKMIKHFSENNKAVYNLNLLYLEKVFENVLYERYTDLHRPLYTFLPFNYQKIPAIFRYRFQKFFKNNNPAKIVFPSWPYEKSLEELRKSTLNNFEISQKNNFKKLIWPENKQYSLVLTHDIESGDNWKWVKIIAEIEKEYGFKSSWNIVPKLYKIDYNILDWLISNGFEIGLHGYSQDNKLAFLKEDIIRRRIESVQGLVQQYKIKGFRSPSWLRSENLFKVLQDYFIYDCSVLDVDYISSAGIGGCCSIFPYKIGKIIELPTTLPYEFPIQLGVRPIELNNFWREKVEWIKENRGVANLITHPDPFYGGNWPMVDAYRELLKNFAADNNLICMLPYQLAEYFINHVN